MQQGLTLNQVCDILLQRGVIQEEQYQRILSEKDTQTKKLEKIYEISEDANRGSRYNILPSDIIASLNLLCPQDGGEELLTEEKIMREVAAGLGIAFKKIKSRARTYPAFIISYQIFKARTTMFLSPVCCLRVC